jgi:dihydroneopterin aldolase
MPNFTLQMDDMEIVMYLGIHDFEKQTPQRVIISATIETQIEKYDDQGFYDYDDLAGFVRDFNGVYIDTQEELVERIHKFITSSDKVVSAIVHSRKPDVYPDAEGVGLVYGQAPISHGRAPHVVQLDNLAIDMHLGVHPHEKSKAQRVLVSATIVTQIDSYQDRGFYDYDDLVDFIRGLSGTSIETQEELLVRVHEFIMASPKVSDALVHTRKPDIYEDAKSIGIVFGALPFPYQQTKLGAGQAGSRFERREAA